MKCVKHNKDLIGKCTWCGKDICQKCITLTDGGKKYCETCSQGDVGKMVRAKQMKIIKEMDE